MAHPPVATHSHGLTRRSRKVLAALALLLAVSAVAPSLAAATPAKPKDTVASVQKKLADLIKQRAQLVEKYDQAQTALADAEHVASVANQDADRANAAFAAAQDAMSLAAAAQYEGGAFSTTGALLSSDSGQSYIDRLGALNMITSHFTQVTENYNNDKHAAAAAAKAASAAVASATQLRNSLAAQRKNVDAQLLTYRIMLAKLTVPQQVAFRQTMSPSVSSVAMSAFEASVAAAPADAADRALKFALDQIGKPYVYGAAGPDSYDCSGLTMAAYASVGISLPHSAAEQYNYGHHVQPDIKDLKKGDLIFDYQPIGHVMIYAGIDPVTGQGIAVSAPTEGEDVKLTPIDGWTTPVGATRLVG